jgi:hypothetical protein
MQPAADLLGGGAHRPARLIHPLSRPQAELPNAALHACHRPIDLGSGARHWSRLAGLLAGRQDDQHWKQCKRPNSTIFPNSSMFHVQ